jgi:hypothetical protein
MFGWTVIGIPSEIAIGGTTDTGLARRILPRVGWRPAMMESAFMKVTGTAIADGVSTTIVGIEIVTAILVGTAIVTAIGTTTGTGASA